MVDLSASQQWTDSQRDRIALRAENERLRKRVAEQDAEITMLRLRTETFEAALKMIEAMVVGSE